MKCVLILVGCVTLFFSSAAVAREVNNSWPPLLTYPNFWIVRANVIDVQSMTSEVHYTIRVTHIYYPCVKQVPENLSRLTVIESLERRFNGNSPAAVRVPRGVDEIGIWLLEETGTAGEFKPIRGEHLRVEWPALAGGPVEVFTRVEAFAEAIEGVGAAGSAFQIRESLRRLATSSIPEVSAWAIGSLVAAPKSFDADVEFLCALGDKRELSIAGAIAIDEALSLTRSQWQMSPERLARIQAWVHKPRTEEDVRRILTRIDSIAQQPKNEGVGQEQLLKLIDAAVRNQSWPIADRCRALRIVCRVAGTVTDDSAEFLFVLKMACSSDALDFATTAAESLFHFKSDRVRRSQVLNAMENAGNREVLKLLDTWLERDNDTERRNGKPPRPLG